MSLNMGTVRQIKQEFGENTVSERKHNVAFKEGSWKRLEDEKERDPHNIQTITQYNSRNQLNNWLVK